MDTSSRPSSPTGPAPLLTPPVLSSPERMKESMKALEELSHSNRLAISAAEQSDKGTEPAYARHLKSYLSWWSTDQGMRMAQAPGWKEIPALPITALKVSLFLSYETTREKVYY
ncbi:hypothetical protein C8J57DRAFT_1108882 [Mycena rebaudengoi]|nr:hypothetical protein C8J57DRAFT_1108882 [Mycena rebaudengoi]